MKMLNRSGVELAIITGRTSQLVALRAINLGVTHLYQGSEDKLAAFLDVLEKSGLDPAECAYMGDDVVDLPVMRRCGLAVCVPAAPALVKQHSHYITQLPGGGGAVRELCELIMQAQGTFELQMAPYLK
jgi:3-deoxy-D-manno-octulosonate 8-phosphate phosphatase (KDO 8-P phosphatase)